MREFDFELRLCARLEADRDGVVARQVGASAGAGGGRRVVDVLAVSPGPEFDERTALTDAEIPAAAVEADASVGAWRPVTRVFDARPERARRLAERAAEVGFLEYERRGGRDVVRQVARYPDWWGALVGVENKPDLGDPGDLELQLRKDVSLGLLDEVVLATASYVTRAHLNRIPEEVGVWRVDFDRADPVEVVREPTPLPSGEPGLQVVAKRRGRTEVRPVTAEEKARKRRRVAERAYGKGWRPDFPACARVEARAHADTPALPHCAWKGRVVNPGAECGPDCPGHETADPPDVDAAAERDRRTGWVADPEGRARSQSRLDRFG